MDTPAGSAWHSRVELEEKGQVPETPTTQSRRLHERRTIAATAFVYEIDEHGEIVAGFGCETIDISRSGLGLRSRRMVHTGMRVVVQLLLTGGASKVLHGCVRYSRYDAKGNYHIGVRFESFPICTTARQRLRAEGMG